MKRSGIVILVVVVGVGFALSPSVRAENRKELKEDREERAESREKRLEKHHLHISRYYRHLAAASRSARAGDDRAYQDNVDQARKELNQARSRARRPSNSGYTVTYDNGKIRVYYRSGGQRQPVRTGYGHRRYKRARRGGVRDLVRPSIYDLHNVRRYPWYYR